MRLAVLAALWLFSACGHPGGKSVPSGPPAAEEGKLPSGPPLVTPGERMSYKLSLQGVSLATYGFSVGEVQDLAGKQVIVAESHAKSAGIADWVARIDDRFTSWIDVETGRSRRFQTAEYETNSKTNVEHVVADFAGRDGDRVPVTFHMNDEAPTPEPQKVTKPDVWDYNTFLIALRAWEQPPGSKVSVEVFRSRYLWNVDMTVRGKEKIRTELPDLAEVTALRLDAHMYKLDRDGGKYPNSDERDLSIWISDDDGRVPLRTTARTDYGDIKMEIVDYQPGSGQRLRP
ncbi:MAG TPA: DUF3108 domain-containing protein [Kofleriaceae bacterium]|nr:DUF3108 domain-containing protein [Kofleriaceae bacterium]